MAGEAWSSDEEEIAALFARLRDEIAGGEPAARQGGDGAGRAPASRALARTEAERFWAVTAERPFLYKPGPWGRLRGLLLVPVKAVLRRLMRWYVEPAFAQQRDFNSRVLRALDDLSERTDGLAEDAAATAGAFAEQLARTAAELEGAVVPLRQSVDSAERLLAEADERLLRVERRVRRQAEPAVAEAASAPVRSAPDAGEPDYFAFESRMRGSSELIRERQAVYADEFRDAAPVLDIGCGRGEFLETMRAAGVHARGIDLSEESVATCRHKGLDAEVADLFVYLERLPEASLDGVFCAQVVEHLPPERLQLVPLPAEPAFAQARQLLDADVNRLNDVVFGPQDYAVLART